MLAAAVARGRRGVASPPSPIGRRRRSSAAGEPRRRFSPPAPACRSNPPPLAGAAGRVGDVPGGDSRTTMADRARVVCPFPSPSATPRLSRRLHFVLRASDTASPQGCGVGRRPELWRTRSIAWLRRLTERIYVGMPPTPDCFSLSLRVLGIVRLMEDRRFGKSRCESLAGASCLSALSQVLLVGDDLLGGGEKQPEPPSPIFSVSARSPAARAVRTEALRSSCLRCG